MRDDDALRFDLAIDPSDRHLTYLYSDRDDYLERGETLVRNALQNALERDGERAVGEMAAAMLCAMCEAFLTAYGGRRALIAFSEALRFNVRWLRYEYRKSLQ